MQISTIVNKTNLKRAAKFFAIFVTVVAIGGIVLWWLLQPPGLDVPDRVELAFGNVHIVNPGSERLEGRTLVTRDGFIAELSETDARVSGDEAYNGMYVLPGLIDMHVHFPPRAIVGNQELFALMFLAHGVTSVRDMGSADGSIFRLRDDIRTAELPGPRIFACNQVIDGEPAAFPSNRVVTTPSDARRAVDELAEAGADHIKAYHMLSAECLHAIREQAETHGLRVVGHVPLSTPVESGIVQDVQHLTGIPAPSDLGDLKDDLAEWSLSDALAIDDARIDHLIDVFLEKDIAFTPTIINPRMRRKQCGPMSDPQDDALSVLPDLWPGAWGFVFGTPYTPGDEWDAKFHQQWDKYKEITYKFHKAGVEIHAGTDTMMPYVAPGKSLHGELEEFVSAGLTPDEAWRAATTRAGAYLTESGLGTIKAGAPADFLVFTKDPTQDLNNLDTLVAVVADGRLYTRKYLDDAIASYKAHFHGTVYDTAMAAPVKIIQRIYAPD